MNDLTFLPAVQMAEQIRHRKISPVELVEAHLRKIKKLNPVLNAFVQVDAEGAFRQAREAEVAVRRGRSWERCMEFRLASRSRLKSRDSAVKREPNCGREQLHLKTRRWCHACVMPEQSFWERQTRLSC